MSPADLERLEAAWLAYAEAAADVHRIRTELDAALTREVEKREAMHAVERELHPGGTGRAA
jgi:hypothetical protein